MWTCQKCGTKVDPSFDVCWECGTSIEGVEDPTFVNADDTGPIADAPVPDSRLTEELSAELAPADALDNGASDLPSEELVECYWAKNELEAKFLAERLIEMGIPATPDEENIQGSLPIGPYFGPRIRVLQQDYDRAHAWLEEYDREHKQHAEPGLGD